MDNLVKAARRGLACLDLTNLNDDCTHEDIDLLCERAQTPHGPVAAVCLWPQFISQARTRLHGTGIRVATVVSFPEGDHPVSDVIAMTEKAVANGADEIDLVVPYKALMEGHPENIPARVARVKEACDGAVLKAILETGVLSERALIAEAAKLAIDGGADFIKTSTGKVRVNATPQAVEAMLEVIRTSKLPVGLKPSGGVRTTEDAKLYLDMCDAAMGPDWVSPTTFRFGASGVLDALLATLEGQAAPDTGDGY